MIQIRLGQDTSSTTNPSSASSAAPNAGHELFATYDVDPAEIFF